jgi:Domain of unknown function (DUF4278)
MMNLIYRGISYTTQVIATSTELSSKTLKYRGCTYDTSSSTQSELTAPTLKYRGCAYNISNSTEQPTPQPKLIYRGCQVA